MTKAKKQKPKVHMVDAYIDSATNIQNMVFELSQYADDLFADAPENTTAADLRKIISIEAKLKKIHGQAIGF